MRQIDKILLPHTKIIIRKFMAKRKLSVSEVQGVVENESLGYAIQHAINFKEIKDQDLADLWERATDLLLEIENYIEDNADDVSGIDENDEDGDDEDYDE